MARSWRKKNELQLKQRSRIRLSPNASFKLQLSTKQRLSMERTSQFQPDQLHQKENQQWFMTNNSSHQILQKEDTIKPLKLSQCTLKQSLIRLPGRCL